jgi:hypothetical protein
MYSFGVLAYELLSRKMFFSEEMWIADVSDKVCGGIRPEIPDCIHPNYHRIITTTWVLFRPSHPNLSAFQHSNVPTFQRSSVPAFQCPNITTFQRSSVPAFQPNPLTIPQCTEASKRGTWREVIFLLEDLDGQGREIKERWDPPLLKYTQQLRAQKEVEELRAVSGARDFFQLTYSRSFRGLHEYIFRLL